MATCKDCEFGGSCVMLHKSDSQVCNIFTHKKDYVEVVRCKDCKHCIYISYACGDVRCGKLHTDYIKEGDFCSYGERREEE